MHIAERLAQVSIEEEARLIGLEKGKVLRKIMEGLDAIIILNDGQARPDWRTQLKACELAMEVLRMTEKQPIQVFIEPTIITNEENMELMRIEGRYANSPT